MVTLDSGLGARSGRWTRLAWLGVAVALVAGLAWYVTHPAPLPPSDGHVETRTRLGSPVFVGIPTGRDLTVRSWEIDLGDGQGDLLVCRDGSVGVTSSPESFCSSVTEADGAHLDANDSLVLEVSSSRYSLVVGGPLHIAWREGIQLGEQDAGPTLSVMVTQ